MPDHIHEIPGVQTARKYLEETYPDEELLFADGFDDAILGTGERCGQPLIVVYDVGKCIDILVEQQGMDREEAIEFFEFNTLGAWVGERTPLFLLRAPPEDGE